MTGRDDVWSCCCTWRDQLKVRSSWGFLVPLRRASGDAGLFLLQAFEEFRIGALEQISYLPLQRGNLTVAALCTIFQSTLKYRWTTLLRKPLISFHGPRDCEHTLGDHLGTEVLSGGRGDFRPCADGS
jgi:hypothetical protein